MRVILKVILILLITWVSIGKVIGQSAIEPGELGGKVNIVNTAVPFLDITPDSRGGAMGNAGVATTPDLNSQHWNPSKFAFIDGNSGIAVSYVPWLRDLVSDINLYYLTGFYRLDDMQVISGSLRYFTLGGITMRETADDIGYQINPNELAFDVGYSRILSDHFSGSVAFRYIRSDLFQSGGQHGDMSAGTSFAADISFFYNRDVNWFENDSRFAAGINISNIGSKISYDGGHTEEFIPTNLRLGTSLTTDLDEYNSISFSLDANKLLVPTPPAGIETSEEYVEEYRDKSVISGMFSSFGDAPGGFSEEMQEISLAFGIEYWYANQFALRGGYFHEHENKGNRKHFTAGIGLKFNMVTLDASYLIPTVSNNPLANTVRFTLGVDLDQVGL
ncbi:type IX secretion system outer membrane channel protein PorV [Marinilabiliaceae bacterium ANBcel2]|nr:type IX secretion system outer membrane channel protein PorV [Marinilabiliaceae bacterium ANBcel2]